MIWTIPEWDLPVQLVLDTDDEDLVAQVEEIAREYGFILERVDGGD